MKAKHKRMWLIILGLLVMGFAAWLLLASFRDNLVFFYSPSELLSKDLLPGKTIRVGGMVKEGSIYKDGSLLEFVVTDYKNEVKIRYDGIPPALFREEQGMVAEGVWNNSFFEAESLLAKHDENYMPPEVKKALEKDK